MSAAEREAFEQLQRRRAWGTPQATAALPGFGASAAAGGGGAAATATATATVAADATATVGAVVVSSGSEPGSSAGTHEAGAGEEEGEEEFASRVALRARQLQAKAHAQPTGGMKFVPLQTPRNEHGRTHGSTGRAAIENVQLYPVSW